MTRRDLSLEEARRIALASQGLDRPRPRGRVDARHLRRTVRRLGLLQLDFVKVLVPAHYLVPFSRLGPYARAGLDRLVYERRELTEQWAHEASIVPVECWPLLEHRRREHRVRPYGFESFLEQNPEYVSRALELVRTQGPIVAGDLPTPEGTARRLETDWGGTVPGAVLEACFGRGILAVAGRRANLAREYDLAQRVIPPEHHETARSPEDAQRELVATAARAHGVATAADLADYWRMPARDARARIAELREAGELSEVRVEGWRGPAWLHREARLPRAVTAATLLSPFDPLIWTRRRTERLFGFEYRLEIYVPPARRRFGYYVLPFLLGDELVARVDLRADRESGHLRVLAAHLEAGAEGGAVAEALAAELRILARWLGLDEVAVGRRGSLARPLSEAVRA